MGASRRSASPDYGSVDVDDINGTITGQHDRVAAEDADRLALAEGAELFALPRPHPVSADDSGRDLADETPKRERRRPMDSAVRARDDNFEQFMLLAAAPFIERQQD
jgi:hypothetical protein